MNFLNELSFALQNKYIAIPLFIFFGACFASFFNVVSLRFPKIQELDDKKQVKEWLSEKGLSIPQELNEQDESYNLSFPASHCFTCKHPLKWYHNIPILSYLLLKGKCAFCKTPYSSQYFIVELLGGVLSAFVYYHFFNILPITSFLFLYVVFLITFLLLIVDFKTMYLPDEYNYFLLWSSLIATALSFNFMQIDLKDSVLGVVIIYSLTWVIAFTVSKLKGVEAMGGGDLKLLAAFGAMLGVKGALFTLLYSPVIGILFYIYFKVRNKDSSEFPYGPALILSAWTYIICGNHIFKLLGA